MSVAEEKSITKTDLDAEDWCLILGRGKILLEICDILNNFE